LEERIETLANQRAGAVTRFLGNHPQAGSALGAQVIGIALRMESFLFELSAGAEGGFQLTRVVLPVMAGEREIVDVERPLGNVLPDAQHRQLIRGEAGPLGGARNCSRADFS